MSCHKKIMSRVLEKTWLWSKLRENREVSNDITMGTEDDSKKSVYVAYFLWLFGGIFGAHHFYLHRDRHAFVWWSSLGGFCGFGWLMEVFEVRNYVLEYNSDVRFLRKLAGKIRQFRTPPFNSNRFLGAFMIGYSWGQMFKTAVPEAEVFGINWKFLYILTPFAVALGVWTVGNIGREEGKLWVPVVAAYLSYPLRYYFYDETVWFSAMVLTSALAFDYFAKQWRILPKKRRPLKRRVSTLALCACIYMGLWCSYLYFNATITDAGGDEVPIHEAIHHFFTSPWWLDVKQSLEDTYTYAQHHGWYEVWRQIIDLSDLTGEQNAYKVLEVGPDSSQQQITSAWRRLSKENHPDKVKDPDQRKEAQNRFMEIQAAYETLSNIKHRRSRKNKKDNNEF